METNRIYNGNCLEVMTDTSLFPDNCINLIVTSPPYADKRMNTYGGVHPDKYVEWFLPIANELFRVLKDDGSMIINIKEHPKNGERLTYVLELILELKKQGWYWIEEYCWYKKNSFPGKWPNRLRDSWERCLHFTKNKKFKMNQEAVMVDIGDWAAKRFKSMSENDFLRHVSRNNSHLGRNVSNWLDKKKVFPHNVIVFEEEHRLYRSNIFEAAVEASSSKNHSAIFPIELPTWFILLFTNDEDIVLDPFMGSGSTAVAALLNNRKYLGTEIQEEYVKEANSNIEDVKTNVINNKRKSHNTKKQPFLS